MGKALTLVTIFNSMMLAQTSEVNEGPADLRVSVSIFDYGGVPPHVLAQAEKSTTRLLGEAGLEVKLMECSSPAAPGRTSADCRKRLGPAEIVVRILPGFRQGDKSVLGHSLGAAYATVYYEGAVKFAGRQLASEGSATGPILGCAIVHEIGHLLLGPNQHSPRGMMRAQWSSEELKLITDSSLHFTAQQAEAIRAEVNRRNPPGQAVTVGNSPYHEGDLGSVSKRSPDGRWIAIAEMDQAASAIMALELAPNQ